MIPVNPTKPPRARLLWLLLLPLLALPGMAQGCGDCDGDGDIDVLDSLAAARMGAGLTVPSPVQVQSCDVNSSTVIDVIDALLMAQVAVGLPVTLFCPGSGNAPPTASGCARGADHDDIPITYDLLDPEGDVCSITPEFSTDGGVSWVGVCTEQPAGSQGTSGLAAPPGGVAHIFVWDSLADTGPASVANVVVRITPRDTQNGFSCQTLPFTVINSPVLIPPTAQGCTATPPACGCDVPVGFALVDPDSPAVDILVEWSTSGGASWSGPATEGPGSSGTVSLAASGAGVGHTFIWDACADLPPGVHGSCQLRVTPDDGNPGTPCTTISFAVDLSSPPSRPAGVGMFGPPTTGVVDIWVLAAETGAPLPGASVMVGDAPDTPFVGNHGTTDGVGHIRFCDPSLTGLNIVTAGASSRQYVTYHRTSASQLVLSLELIDSFPTMTEVTGKETGVGLPGCLGTLIGAGIAVPVATLDDILTGFAGLLLGPLDCWQSGHAMAGDMAVPGNMYLPDQTVGPLCLGGSINAHDYLLRLPQGSQQRLGGVFGEVDALTVSGATTQVELLNAFSMQEVCLTTTFTVTGTTMSQDTPRTGNVNGGLTMTVASAPAGMDVLGVTLGDLSGANGTGPMVLLGARAAPYTGPSSQNLSLTVAPASAVGVGSLGYVGLASAMYLDNPAPPVALANAMSIALKRDGGISSSGGSITLNTFFVPPTLTAPVSLPGTFSWSDPSIAAPDLVDLGFHRLVRQVESPPVSLSPCVGSRVDQQSSSYWVIYTRDNGTTFTLPTLPPSFPRAAAAGLFDPVATPEQDSLIWNASFLGWGGTGLPSAPVFDFDALHLDDLPANLTHMAGNQRTL